MLSAVLVAVGGTLWPDRLTVRVPDDLFIDRIAYLLPSIDPKHALTVLRSTLTRDRDMIVQNTHAVLREAIQRNGVRGAAEYWRDFADLGVAHLINGVVTSLDADTGSRIRQCSKLRLMRLAVRLVSAR